MTIIIMAKKTSTNKNILLARKCQNKNFTAYQCLQIILLTGIFGIIIAESSHQNHWDQASEKNDHHKWVEDGEPMDLQERQNRPQPLEI